MHGRREIRIAHSLAREPRALARQPADISEMIADVVARRTDRTRVGRPAALIAAHRLLVDAFRDQEGRHLGEHFFMEPARQPPNLNAPERIWRQQALLAGL